MSKINSLTEEQQNAIPGYLKKCLSEGTSCDPIDRKKAKRAVCRAYKERGLKRPKHFFFAESPLGASFLLAILRYNNDENYNIDGLSIEELERRYKKIPKKKRTNLEVPFMRGQHDFSWLGFFGFLTEVVGLSCDEIDVSPHLEVVRNCGWWMPFEDTVIICNRPNNLFRDQDNRLHYDQGPAVSFRDGWNLYFWHGVAVPGEWIENKDSIDPSEVFRVDNAEERRSLAEILGWDKVLDSLNPRVIDKDTDPMIGELLEVELPGIENGEYSTERFLKVRCGTGRDFVLPVSPNTKTALEANASTFGIDPKELLNLEVRT